MNCVYKLCPIGKQLPVTRIEIMLLTLELLITKCTCPSKNAAELNCKTHELPVTYSMYFPFLIAALIVAILQVWTAKASS